MNMKKTFWVFGFVMFVVTLVGCGNDSSKIIVNKPTVTRALPTSTLLSSHEPSQTPLPTFTLAPITPMPTPTPTSLPFYSVGIYRTVYSKDGNLYLQDDKNSPTQLTNSGKEDFSPRLFADGKKIVFSRREFSDAQGIGEIYSINADGSQEQVLVTKKWFASLVPGTSMVIEQLIPESHNLLLKTILCQDEQDKGTCIASFYIVNSDTGKIIKFMEPFLMSTMAFCISPNGKMISVASAGNVDIYNLNGDIVYPNVMSYTVSTPNELFPAVDWFSDSSGLVAALPTNIHAGWDFSYYFTYEVWSYKLGRQAAYISLDSQQPAWITFGCGSSISVSPDGSLIFYSRESTFYSNESTLYLGHLQDGHTQMIGVAGCWDGKVFWNPDNRHFIYRDRTGDTLIGSVDGTSSIPFNGGEVLSWIDEVHFTYVDFRSKSYKILVGEIGGEKLLTYDSGIVLPINSQNFSSLILYNEIGE